MTMNIHESVRDYLRGERNKANPVLCYTAETDTLTVESGLSPHDGQIVLCSVEFAGNPLLAYDPQDDQDICLLYTSDAADDLLCVDLGGRRII